MLADVVRETEFRPFHVNVPEINFKGEKTV